MNILRIAITAVVFAVVTTGVAGLGRRLDPVHAESQGLFDQLNVYGGERKRIFCSIAGDINGQHRIEGYIYQNRFSLLAGKGLAFQLEDPADPHKPGVRHAFNGTCDISY